MSEEERATINNLSELTASCENLPEDYSSGTKKEEVFTENVMTPETKPSSTGGDVRERYETVSVEWNVVTHRLQWITVSSVSVKGAI